MWQSCRKDVIFSTCLLQESRGRELLSLARPHYNATVNTWYPLDGALSAKLQGKARQGKTRQGKTVEIQTPSMPGNELRLNREQPVALFPVLPWYKWTLVNQFISCLDSKTDRQVFLGWSEIHWHRAILSNNIQGVPFRVFFNMELLVECLGGYRRFTI